MKKFLFFIIVFLMALTMSIYSITADVVERFNRPVDTVESSDEDESDETVNDTVKEETDTDSDEQEDEEIPVLEVIERTVECRYLTDYDLYSNVIVTYDGELSYSYKDEQIGDDDNDHSITVTVKTPGGKTASVSYNLHETKTKDKDIFVIGDSIVKGFGAGNVSFADYLGNNYDFVECYKCGNNDYRLSTYDDANKWLVTAGSQYLNDQKYNFDYIIIEGGINDVFYDTPLGEKSDTGKDTFTGGLRMYLDTITKRWPEARIGYLVTYYPLNYSESGKTWTEADYKKYHDRMIEILDEYKLEYLDLSEDEYMEMLKAGEKTYLPDYLHPNTDGHKILSEIIYDWVEDLKPYE